jgi:hypothetical protein
MSVNTGDRIAVAATLSVGTILRVVLNGEEGNREKEGRDNVLYTQASCAKSCNVR